jgi:PTS system nitrogen regulatory IIA component
MNTTTTTLSLPRTLCRAGETSKKRVFETAAKIIATDQAYLQEAEVFSALNNRERLGSTAMGHGIAIPHCRIANCPQPIGTLITLAEPVNFDAHDGQPVDTIFVLLVPEQAHQEHLDILATLAKTFSNSDNRELIRAATTKEELYRCTTDLLSGITAATT